MRKTKQTALTAAVFAAAIGISGGGSIASAAETGRYLTETGAGIMQVLYGPAPIEQQTISGDVNMDKMLDAKDLTLIKREALGLQEEFDLKFQLVDDDEWDGADARALVQKLTGEWDRPNRPYVFWLTLRPVAYFPEDEPEDAEQRDALITAAQEKLKTIQWDPLKVRTASGAEERLLMDYPSYHSYNATKEISLFCDCYVELTDGFAPNDYAGDDEDPDGDAMPKAENCHRTVIDYSYTSYTAESRQDDDPPAPVQSERSGGSFSFLTYKQDPEKGNVYYDKCLVEWNVNTGKIRVHDPLEMGQDIVD